jgi:hypothetical protein
MGTAGRILLGIVLAAGLLGLAALEVVSERVRVSPVTATESFVDPEVRDGIGWTVVLGNDRQEAGSPKR